MLPSPLVKYFLLRGKFLRKPSQTNGVGEIISVDQPLLRIYGSKHVLIATDANASCKPRFERNILVPEWLPASHDWAMTEE
jgi:hypothetical protein